MMLDLYQTDPQETVNIKLASDLPFLLKALGVQVKNVIFLCPSKTLFYLSFEIHCTSFCY